MYMTQYLKNWRLTIIVNAEDPGDSSGTYSVNRDDEPNFFW